MKDEKPHLNILNQLLHIINCSTCIVQCHLQQEKEAAKILDVSWLTYPWKHVSKGCIIPSMQGAQWGLIILILGILGKERVWRHDLISIQKKFYFEVNLLHPNSSGSCLKFLRQNEECAFAYKWAKCWWSETLSCLEKSEYFKQFFLNPM